MFGLMLAQVSGAWGSAFGSGTNKSVLHNILNTLFRVLSALFLGQRRPFHKENIRWDITPFSPTFVGGGACSLFELKRRGFSASWMSDFYWWSTTSFS